MEMLTIDTMICGLEDVERKQYQVLGALKERREEFSRNRLFPWLSEILQLSEDLHALIQNRDGLARHMPQHLKDVDLERMHLVYEAGGSETEEFARMMEVAQWALPHVDSALEEGRGIYDFVDQHISIDEVGIVPAYREEGYWFVPDTRAALLHLFRYHMSIYSAPGERYRALKTTELDAIEGEGVGRSLEMLKLEVVRKYADLPNPATYRCGVDIDFPYTETLLPVAKRKLMARLAA